MLIKHSLYFTFNGISSETYGILNVNVSGGLFEENFIYSRTINETKIRGRSKRYFQDFEQEKIEFDVEFYIQDGWDTKKINDISRWLCTDYYCSMVFSESPEKVYWCMMENDSSIIHTGNSTGYLKLHFSCSDAYAYSPVYQTQNYTTSVEDVAESATTDTNIKMTAHGLSTGDYIVNLHRNNVIRKVTKVDNNNITVSAVTGQTAGDLILKYFNNATNVEIANYGSIPIRPSIEIFNIGDVPCKIKNLTNEGSELIFTGIDSGETLSIDCENEIVITDKENTWRHDNHNGVFINLIYGVNHLQLTGNFNCVFRYEYKFLI